MINNHEIIEKIERIIKQSSEVYDEQITRNDCIKFDEKQMMNDIQNQDDLTNRLKQSLMENDDVIRNIQNEISDL